MKYSDTHEWIRMLDGVALIGVTALAQRELGDIVYVELPKISCVVRKGEELAVLESTKAAVDIYSPLSGTIVEVNEALRLHPELINQSPEEGGWLCKILPSDTREIDEMDTKDN